MQQKLIDTKEVQTWCKFFWLLKHVHPTQIGHKHFHVGASTPDGPAAPSVFNADRQMKSPSKESKLKKSMGQ